MRTISTLVPVLALTLGCSSAERDPGPDGASGGGLTGGGLTTAGPEEPDTDGDVDPDPTGDDSGGSSGGNDGSDTGDSPPLFDVGGYDPDGDMGEKGCQKVDLLFVIDNSGSMADNQVTLINSFPEFIDGIETQLADVDSYHVGVVTTDSYSYNAPGCIGPGYLVTQTGGENSSNAVCGPYASGSSYMDENDDLTATFSCAAQVGSTGAGDEKPIQSIRGALEPVNQMPGFCNEGFLREDALLVIVVITDEDDQGGIPAPFQPPLGSPGTPPDWFAEIAAIKGVETNVAFLALTGNDDLAPQCAGTAAYHATNLIELAGYFTNGVVGDVCATSYAPFFEQAVSVVDSACDGFTPPG